VQRRSLGGTEISVPVIGLGTWRTFDTDEDRRPLVEASINAGIDLFDSSPMYGRAEAVLAKAIKGWRDRVLIATKIWTSDPDEGREQAQYALRLYGHVDVYQVHNLVNAPRSSPCWRDSRLRARCAPLARRTTWSRPSPTWRA
jgi:diketogulonate reductase-like aldo/keto reductase